MRTPSLAADEVLVTGELAVEILAPIRAGERYRILSRVLEQKGKRSWTTAAMHDAEGRQCAVATATWFSVAPSVLAKAA